MSIPNLNFYSLQSTFYCKKLKSCRHDAVKSEKKTPVYAMSKGRLHFFGNWESFFGNTLRRHAFGLNTVNDAAESFCITAVKFCSPAEEAVKHRAAAYPPWICCCMRDIWDKYTACRDSFPATNWWQAGEAFPQSLQSLRDVFRREAVRLPIRTEPAHRSQAATVCLSVPCCLSEKGYIW